MEAQSSKSPHPMMWIAGIAIVIFCVAGVAAIMGWIPASKSNQADAANVPLPEVQTANAIQPVDQPAARTEHRKRATSRAASNAPAPVICAQCGVIESMQEINTKGKGTGLGVVGGAVVGGLIGNQIGNGRGNDLATVAGVVGGAVAGNQIEKSAKSTKSYDITIRFDDGSSNVIHEAYPSAWRLGDRVKVVNGVIRSNG